MLPAGFGETSCLLPSVSFPGRGKVLGKFFPRAPSWLQQRPRPWNNAWKGGRGKNSPGRRRTDSSKQQQCIVCGGSVLELFPTDLWIGLGSPACRLGSSQLRGPVLDSHSLVTSFPAPGFAFPKESYRSPPWLVFQGMFPKLIYWRLRFHPQEDTMGLLIWAPRAGVPQDPSHARVGASGSSQGPCQ